MLIPVFKEPIAYFDCDDTLISWSSYPKRGKNSIEFIDPADNRSIYLNAIEPTIEALKLHKVRNHTIIVWSAGGALWAKEVVSKLGLEKYVDACMAKPNWIYDDLPAAEFIPECIRKDLRYEKD